MERKVLVNLTAKQLLSLERGDHKKGEKVGREIAARHQLTSLEFTQARLLVDDLLTERIVGQVADPGTPLETMARTVFGIASLPKKAGILADFLIGKNKVK